MIFVFVKARDTLRALRPFAGQLNPSTAIVSLQNGLGNEEAIKTALGGNVALVIGATTEAALLTMAKASVRRIGVGRTVVGSAPARPHRPVERVTALLSSAGLDARSAYDIRPHLWGKLIANAAINPVSALLERDNGIILDDPDAGGAGAGAIAFNWRQWRRPIPRSTPLSPVHTGRRRDHRQEMPRVADRRRSSR